MSTIGAHSAGRPAGRVIFVLAASLMLMAAPRVFANESDENSHDEDRAALNATWDGIWFSPTRGFVYAAEMHLEVDPKNKAQGHIKWTLKSSPRASEQAKIGLTGVEYVRGKYNPNCKILSIDGVRKDDPHSILGLDKYRLILAENRIALGGITASHGTWRGAFSLGRRAEQ